MSNPRKQIVVAMTGASGAPYTRRLLQCLTKADVEVHFVATPAGRLILADELGIKELSAQSLLGAPNPRLTLYSPRDIGARIASGSFLTAGMVICPCSSHSLAALAAGLADNLVTRAALVTMKEARRLILVSRETPLSPIEIENMLKLSRAGAIICPASPGFYMLPKSIDELLDFVVGRVMDLLGVPHQLNVRWDPQSTEKVRVQEME